MTGASLAVAIIGQSLAQARGLLTKHAVKQVDRLLSNPGIEAWDIFATWVPEMVGSRTDIVVALDWTDYAADGQATLALKLVTRHGRATPLVWLSVHKDELAEARNADEDACLRPLAEVLPAGVTCTILADRGFADTRLFDFLAELGFGYVIRLNTTVGLFLLVENSPPFQYAFRAALPRKNAQTGGVRSGVVYRHIRPEWKVQL